MSKDKEIVLRVKKEALIDWYFSNWDRHEAHLFLYDVRKEIINSGKYSLAVEEIADRIGYVPSHILEGHHEEEEYDYWDKIELI